MAQPYIRFFGADWRSDPCLRACTEASRGVWADMLTFMMEAEPFGHFLVDKDLFCKMTVTRPKVFAQAIAELERNKVFSRTDDGVIYSRRMVREADKAERDRTNGKRGGNPALVNPSGKGRGVNPHRLNGAGLGGAATPHGNGFGKEGSSVGSNDLGGEFE